MMSRNFKPFSPILQIFIVVHPKSPEKLNFFRSLFSFFNRDINNPLSRGLGIPVFCWSPLLNANTNLNSINYDGSNHTIIIALIDYKMVNDDAWSKYLTDLCNAIKENHNHKFIPVALDKTALKIKGGITKLNFIKIDDGPKKNRENYLKIRLSNEITNILNKENVKNNNDKQIKLFLSYAKIDGSDIVKKFRDAIHKTTPLKVFFDDLDIPAGTDFEEFIKKSVLNSCLIAFQTDNYASREWCRREILLSKDYECPIIIVNCLKKGEDRVFPYMGNVPNVRWNLKSQSISDILNLALREILRNLYNKQLLEEYLKYWNDDTKSLKWYRSPEILTCIQLRSKVNIGEYNKFIFPDPPLGIEEIKLLKKSLPSILFMTPTQFLVGLNGINIAGKKIGISMSESPDLPFDGLTLHHLYDVMIEFARYLLASNAIIAYGGDLRQGGFTETLFELSRKYIENTEEPREKIINFLAWPFHRELTEIEEANLKDVATIKKITLPDDLTKYSTIELDTDLLEHRYIVSRALSAMRKEMNKNIDCRIILGGNTSKFLGKYPGLVEEAYYAIQTNKPVYLIGAYGGAASIIIEAIKGKIPKELTLSEQTKNEKYGEFIEFFNKCISENPQITEEIIDYNHIVKFFNLIGIDGLHNGLTNEENIQLFETRNIFEMISLVLKGLSEI